MRITLAVLLLAPLAASAQDMPLFTILKDGEGWKKGEGEKPEPTDSVVVRFGVHFVEVDSPDGGTTYLVQMGAIWAYPNRTKELGIDWEQGALYAPLRTRKAYDNSREARANLKDDKPKAKIIALTVDTDGRIYAATTKELQIFDPTGRLCGVVPYPPKPRAASGKWEDEQYTEADFGYGKLNVELFAPFHQFLRWEGDKKDTLVLWIGDQKWTRKMNATGK